MENEKIRIQKFLSQKGICSRRETEALIRQKRITINGNVAQLGDRVNLADHIAVNGSVIHVEAEVKRVVVAFNKPKGVECTMKLMEGVKTLADYDFKGQRVFPIGRLDKDSHGLLLLTNDGELSNKLMHPKYKKEKEYLVSLNKKIDQSFLKKMAEGVMVGEKLTQPCFCEALDEKILRIILTEGRNRQIRKMAEAFDYRVVDLLRIRMGKILLGELKEGKYRFLSPVEIKSLDRA